MHSSRNNQKVLLNLLILFLICFVEFVSPKAQYVQPLNMGMQMAIPYDIANTFNRPWAIGASTCLSLMLAGVLFFGVITSPFGYMFGIPSRRYVLGSESDPLHSQVREDFATGPRSLNDLSSWSPNFAENVFYLLPEEINDESCRKLVLCVSHGIMRRLPKSALNFYKFFSSNLVDIPSDYQDAIKVGIKEKNACEIEFNCKRSPFNLLISTLSNLVPFRSKRKRAKLGLFS